jgi:hypothetical protein
MLAMAGGAALLRLLSMASEIRAPLLYAFGLYEFASRI